MSEKTPLQAALDQQSDLVKVISHTNEVLLASRDGLTLQSLAYRLLALEREVSEYRKLTTKRIDTAGAKVKEIIQQCNANTKSQENHVADFKQQLLLIQDQLNRSESE